ncbi:hypothetical protein GPECTOR_54g225 [Gonium pectorale]|uniref:Uncharacterized protein n=1 Tax=Gonium pectorale TaxID=33097 RepID=A0A150G6M3_GONPE|nr:hypothetical protein GPECTOR_54g225 [Gonium pectorale]|eukprot:KXZ45484.1 hypothetical protein GPECTOR_54g225 [Gonium pectorale]
MTVRHYDPEAPGEVSPLAWDLLANLYGQVQALGLGDNLIAACASYAQCRLAWGRGYPAFLTPSSLHYNKKALGKVHDYITRVKWLMAAKFLAVGHDTLFVDWDVGINPYSVRTLWDMIDGAHHDWISLSDFRGPDFLQRAQLPPQEAWGCPLDYGASPNPCASTGVWHARASELIAEYAMMVWNKSTHGGAWEQRVFNQLVPAWANPSPFNASRPPLTFRLFPAPEVANLPLLWEVPDWGNATDLVHLVHCGYVHGNGEKLDALKRGFAGVSYLRRGVVAKEDVRLAPLTADCHHSGLSWDCGGGRRA